MDAGDKVPPMATVGDDSRDIGGHETPGNGRDAAHPVSPAGEAEELDLFELLRVVSHGWKIVVAGLLLGLVGGVFLCLMQERALRRKRAANLGDQGAEAVLVPAPEYAWMFLEKKTGQVEEPDGSRLFLLRFSALIEPLFDTEWQAEMERTDDSRTGMRLSVAALQDSSGPSVVLKLTGMAGPEAGEKLEEIARSGMERVRRAETARKEERFTELIKRSGRIHGELLLAANDTKRRKQASESELALVRALLPVYETELKELYQFKIAVSAHRSAQPEFLTALETHLKNVSAQINSLQKRERAALAGGEASDEIVAATLRGLETLADDRNKLVASLEWPQSPLAMASPPRILEGSFGIAGPARRGPTTVAAMVVLGIFCGSVLAVLWHSHRTRKEKHDAEIL